MRITVFFISGLSLVVSAAEYRSSGTTLVRDAVLPYIEKGELPGAISVLEKKTVFVKLPVLDIPMLLKSVGLP